jgi:hypothetical protein
MEKKYRPIVRKIQYLVFVGEFKKNVAWRALFHFGEYLFVPSPFWRVFENNGFPHCIANDEIQPKT